MQDGRDLDVWKLWSVSRWSWMTGKTLGTPGNGMKDLGQAGAQGQVDGGSGGGQGAGRRGHDDEDADLGRLCLQGMWA